MRKAAAPPVPAAQVRSDHLRADNAGSAVRLDCDVWDRAWRGGVIACRAGGSDTLFHCPSWSESEL